MAPLLRFHSAYLHTFLSRSTSTPRRHFGPGLTAWILVLSILFTALLVTACLTTYCVTKSVQSQKDAKAAAETEDHKPSITTIANSNRARKDSHVLWSAYFSEDDLKSQFARQPSQGSRIFSIGPLESDIDTLETEAKEIFPPLVQPSNAGIRGRVPYTQKVTPTKSLRDTGNSADFEDINIRDFALERRLVVKTEPPFLQEILDQPFLGRQRSVTVC
jgi:hypothetical protein